MNKVRREKIKKAIKFLDSAKVIVDSILGEEQDSFDNLNENFQDSEKGEKMEEAIGNLDDAIDYIDSAVESLEEAAQ